MPGKTLRAAFVDKTVLTLATAALAMGTFLVALLAPMAAQAGPAIGTESYAQAQPEEKKAAPAARPAQPNRAAPQRSAPQRSAPQRAAPQRSAPRQAAPQRSAPRVAAPTRAAPRTATQPRPTSRAVSRPAATPRVSGQSKSTPRVAAPAASGRKATLPAATRRVVTPSGTRAVTASRLRAAPARGAGRTVIRGQNYSVWRSGYRVRRGSGWRTFVALSTLGAIAIGSNEYYPYAYISAPEAYCEGLTEDGCELQWQEVQTIQGDVYDQCVAYCPWR
jgi:hypothetical protein